MNRFKNDQTALSNSQYRILENSWLSFRLCPKREGEGEYGTYQLGASTDEMQLWEESDVLPALAALLPFGGGWSTLLPPRPVLSAPAIPRRLLVKLIISKTGIGRDRKNRSNNHLGPEQLSSATKRGRVGADMAVVGSRPSRTTDYRRSQLPT